VKKFPETPQLIPKKHFSPLNCTSPHFSRKTLACKPETAYFFNEINHLERSCDAELLAKLQQKQALTALNASEM
jgi:hypothetical protein